MPPKGCKNAISEAGGRSKKSQVFRGFSRSAREREGERFYGEENTPRTTCEHPGKRRFRGAGAPRKAAAGLAVGPPGTTALRSTLRRLLRRRAGRRRRHGRIAARANRETGLRRRRGRRNLRALRRGRSRSDRQLAGRYPLGRKRPVRRISAREINLRPRRRRGRRRIIETEFRNARRRGWRRPAAAIAGPRQRLGPLVNAGRKTGGNRPDGHTALDLRELARQILHAADTMQLPRPGRAHPVILRLGTGSIGRAHGGDGVERGVGGNKRRPIQMRLIQIGGALRGVTTGGRETALKRASVRSGLVSTTKGAPRASANRRAASTMRSMPDSTWSLWRSAGSGGRAGMPCSTQRAANS